MSTATTQEFMAWSAGVSGYDGPAIPELDRGTIAIVPDRAEELANSITHGVGLVLSIAGLYGLASITRASGIPEHAVACEIFGASLVLLYAASTLYHGWQHEAIKQFLLLLDHIGIYILIAGTYTPMALIPLRGPLGWTLLILAWSFALVGSLAKVGRAHRLDEESPIPYCIMAWMWLAGSGRLFATLPTGELLWFLAGGFFYVAGLYFFLNDHRRFHHTIWHLFVLAGSICHYRTVIGYVMPIAG